jgi:hypothetical protein
MVGKVTRWLKAWLGVDKLKAENLRLAKAILALEKRIVEREVESGNQALVQDDHEVRIAFLENSLTAKASTAKIVPKAHKGTFRQFAEAASKATEEEIAE